MARNKESASSQRKIAGRENSLKALELRKAGKTFTAIGLELGISAMGAHKAVKRAMDELKELALVEAGELLALELERLDAIVAANWPAMEKGDTKAAEIVIKTISERAKLLGLYAPARSQVQVDDKTQDVKEIETPEPVSPAEWLALAQSLAAQDEQKADEFMRQHLGGNGSS